MSHNPFSPNYKSQLDLRDISRERKLSQSRSASLEQRRQSDDPEVRRIAEGTIQGMGKAKSGAPNIAGWPKRGVLNQPPKNPQAVLQTEPAGKSAKLSRGRSI